MKKHLHFLVWAYKQREGDSYRGIVHIDIICKTPQEALQRAERLMPDHLYRIQSIIEHFDKEEK